MLWNTLYIPILGVKVPPPPDPPAQHTGDAKKSHIQDATNFQLSGTPLPSVRIEHEAETLLQNFNKKVKNAKRNIPKLVLVSSKTPKLIK